MSHTQLALKLPGNNEGNVSTIDDTIARILAQILTLTKNNQISYKTIREIIGNTSFTSMVDNIFNVTFIELLFRLSIGVFVTPLQLNAICSSFFNYNGLYRNLTIKGAIKGGSIRKKMLGGTKTLLYAKDTKLDEFLNNTFYDYISLQETPNNSLEDLPAIHKFKLDEEIKRRIISLNEFDNGIELSWLYKILTTNISEIIALLYDDSESDEDKRSIADREFQNLFKCQSGPKYLSRVIDVADPIDEYADSVSKVVSQILVGGGGGGGGGGESEAAGGESEAAGGGGGNSPNRSSSPNIGNFTKINNLYAYKVSPEILAQIGQQIFDRLFGRELYMLDDIENANSQLTELFNNNEVRLDVIPNTLINLYKHNTHKILDSRDDISKYIIEAAKYSRKYPGLNEMRGQPDPTKQQSDNIRFTQLRFETLNLQIQQIIINVLKLCEVAYIRTKYEPVYEYFQKGVTSTVDLVHCHISGPSKHFVGGAGGGGGGGSGGGGSGSGGGGSGSPSLPSIQIAAVRKQKAQEFEDAKAQKKLEEEQRQKFLDDPTRRDQQKHLAIHQEQITRKQLNLKNIKTKLPETRLENYSYGLLFTGFNTLFKTNIKRIEREKSSSATQHYIDNLEYQILASNVNRLRTSSIEIHLIDMYKLLEVTSLITHFVNWDAKLTRKMSPFQKNLPQSETVHENKNQSAQWPYYFDYNTLNHNYKITQGGLDEFNRTFQICFNTLDLNKYLTEMLHVFETVNKFKSIVDNGIQFIFDNQELQSTKEDIIRVYIEGLLTELSEDKTPFKNRIYIQPDRMAKIASDISSIIREGRMNEVNMYPDLYPSVLRHSTRDIPGIDIPSLLRITNMGQDNTYIPQDSLSISDLIDKIINIKQICEKTLSSNLHTRMKWIATGMEMLTENQLFTSMQDFARRKQLIESAISEISVSRTEYSAEIESIKEAEVSKQKMIMYCFAAFAITVVSGYASYQYGLWDIPAGTTLSGTIYGAYNWATSPAPKKVISEAIAEKEAKYKAENGITAELEEHIKDRLRGEVMREYLDERVVKNLNPQSSTIPPFTADQTASYDKFKIENEKGVDEILANASSHLAGKAATAAGTAALAALNLIYKGGKWVVNTADKATGASAAVKEEMWDDNAGKYAYNIFNGLSAQDKAAKIQEFSKNMPVELKLADDAMRKLYITSLMQEYKHGRQEMYEPVMKQIDATYQREQMSPLTKVALAMVPLYPFLYSHLGSTITTKLLGGLSQAAGYIDQTVLTGIIKTQLDYTSGPYSTALNSFISHLKECQDALLDYKTKHPSLSNMSGLDEAIRVFKDCIKSYNKAKFFVDMARDQCSRDECDIIYNWNYVVQHPETQVSLSDYKKKILKRSLIIMKKLTVNKDSQSSLEREIKSIIVGITEVRYNPQDKAKKAGGSKYKIHINKASKFKKYNTTKKQKHKTTHKQHYISSTSNIHRCKQIHKTKQMRKIAKMRKTRKMKGGVGGRGENLSPEQFLYYQILIFFQNLYKLCSTPEYYNISDTQSVIDILKELILNIKIPISLLVDLQKLLLRKK